VRNGLLLQYPTLALGLALLLSCLAALCVSAVQYRRSNSVLVCVNVIVAVILQCALSMSAVQSRSISSKVECVSVYAVVAVMVQCALSS
jgi:hypothetical protein